MRALARPFALMLLSLIVGAFPAFSQAVTVLPASLDPSLREQLISNETIYVNGPFTYGLTEELAAKEYPLGPLRNTLLTLLTLKMQAEGLVDLDEPVAASLPDILADNPFRVAITPRHLLTETGGFAVPPAGKMLSANPAFFRQVRTAGQMAHADPVGWHVLALLLEKKGGAPVRDLLDTYLLKVLNTNAFVSEDLTRGNGTLIAEIVRLTVYNRGSDGKRFLPGDLYEQLMLRHNWRMHPVGPRRTLGGVMHSNGIRGWISPPPISGAAVGIGFMAFPKNDIAFIHLGDASVGFERAVLEVAEDRFLPAAPDTRLQESSGLYEKDVNFTGRYVRSAAPSAWVRDRLTTISNSTVDATDHRDGTLSLRDTKGALRLFHKKAPYYYEDIAGKTLIFSPYRRGGYMVLEGIPYRHIGPLGNRFFVLTAFPIVVGLLLTAALHLRSSTSPRWRKMAFFGTTGTALVVLGAGADYFLWSHVVFDLEQPMFVNIWRLALNVGLAFVLSLPLYAISLVRKQELPTGAGIVYAPLHLATLSISSVMLFLILVMWGLAGEFGAY